MTFVNKERKSLYFTLPMPPSINATYRGAGGRLVYTDVAAAYRDEVQIMLNQDDSVPFRGQCVMWLHVYMKYAVKGDMHNNHKLLLDLLEGHAYLNDNQVVELHITRRYDPINPHVVVQIDELDS